MSRLCITVAILAIFGATVYAESAPLPKDPALDKPVTLAVKGEALADITSAFGREKLCIQLFGGGAGTRTRVQRRADISFYEL